jgi:ATP-dependent DNA helicase RecQ
MKKFMFEGFKEGFTIEDFHQRKQRFVLPPISVNAYAGAAQKRVDSPHPALHQQLRKLRDAICSRKDIPIYIVAGSNTIDEMATYLPQTLTELRKISGFGDAKILQYGQQFLDVILEYCTKNNLSSLIHEKSPKRERKSLPADRRENTGTAKKKGDTHAETYKLYKEGQTVAGIAKARNLTVATIETHLAKFVRMGDIKIEELVSREKILIIESAVKEYSSGSIIPIKQKLGDDISFGEIRLVMAGLGISQERSPD